MSAYDQKVWASLGNQVLNQGAAFQEDARRPDGRVETDSCQFSDVAQEHSGRSNLSLFQLAHVRELVPEVGGCAFLAGRSRGRLPLMRVVPRVGFQAVTN